MLIVFTVVSVSITGSPSTGVRFTNVFVCCLRIDIFSLAGAIIFTIIAVLSIMSYFGFRSRIPLASLLLQVVMDVSKHHTSVYAVAFAALFVQAALSVFVWTLVSSTLLFF